MLPIFGWSFKVELIPFLGAHLTRVSGLDRFRLSRLSCKATSLAFVTLPWEWLPLNICRNIRITEDSSALATMSLRIARDLTAMGGGTSVANFELGFFRTYSQEN